MADSPSLAQQFFECGVVKIDFETGWTMKSGLWSPIYLNFRVLQSYPRVLSQVVAGFTEKIRNENLNVDLIAGIPLAALPLSLGVSMATEIPHVLPRMDSKKHGLKVRVDGVFEPGQRVLLIDDLITKATSKLEAVDELTQAGLVVEDVMVILDRQQGGSQELQKKNLRLHSLLTLEELLTALESQAVVPGETITKIRQYLAENQ